MRVLFDLNVIVDVLARREPFATAAARAMDQVLYGHHEGCIPAHGMTTIYYLIRRGSDRRSAQEAVQWMLNAFRIIPCTQEILVHASTLSINDFEDAVVAASAEFHGCERIITRNTVDFVHAAVMAVTPDEFLTEA